MKKTREQLKNENIKFIPCSETKQTFSFQRTNKKAYYNDKNLNTKK